MNTALLEVTSLRSTAIALRKRKTKNQLVLVLSNLIELRDHNVQCSLKCQSVLPDKEQSVLTSLEGAVQIIPDLEVDLDSDKGEHKLNCSVDVHHACLSLSN